MRELKLKNVGKFTETYIFNDISNEIIGDQTFIDSSKKYILNKKYIWNGN